MSRAAQLMGKKGGKRRAQTTTPEQRAAWGRKGGKLAGRGRPKKANRGLSDKELAGGLGISAERFGAALNEAGLRPHPEKAERGRMQAKKGKGKTRKNAAAKKGAGA